MRSLNFLLMLFLFSIIQPTLGQTEYNLAAFYYPWYSSSRKIHWQEGFLREKLSPQQLPKLGYYDSFSNSIIDQHIIWSIDYGIDSWIVSWWGQQSNEDNWLNSYIKNRLEGTKIKFCILYESGELPSLDWDNTTTRNKFKNDLLYIANKYFDHPSYLKIENKPVIYVYITRGFTGDHSLGIQEARQALLDKGYEIFFIADGMNNLKILNDYDALSLYLGLENGDCMSRDGSYPYQNDCFDDIEFLWNFFKSKAKEAGIKFIPNVAPGFNKDGWGSNPNEFWACPPRIHPDSSHVSVLSKMCDLAKKYIDSSFNYVTITSFNEWHEDTQIEPTVVTEETNIDISNGLYANGYFYKGYGTDRLEVIAKKFNKTITGIEPNTRSIPNQYSLEQNYPNPFNPETAINYQLSTSSYVTLKVYDILGNEVATLVDEYQQPGKYKLTFNGLTIDKKQLSSGIYFYRLQAGEFNTTKKMQLLK